MGYHRTSDRRWADTEDIVLAPLALRDDAEATGTEFELGDRATVRLALTVTAKAGTTPTLDVTIETSHDGVTWYEAGAFAQLSDPTVTTPVVARKVFAIDRFVRAKWEVGGSADPSLTFALAGEAA